MDALDTIYGPKGLFAEIYHDDFSGNPRKEWDNLGFMTCFHGRYNLGDDHGFESPEELEEFLDSEEVISLPLYLYDHSGITMSTRPFSCPWDSGQVGHIYVTKEQVRIEYGWKRITKKRYREIEDRLRSEVKIYDQYLTGQVYGYVIFDRHGEELDSCWGFYENDYMKDRINDMMAYFAKKMDPVTLWLPLPGTEAKPLQMNM